MRWRTELSCYNYDIVYRPGKKNLSADAFSRVCGAAVSSPTQSISQLHNDLCHPGVQRLLHFVKSKNLPISTDEVRRACAGCQTCAELKPRFYKPTNLPLIKAMRPFERLSLDFVGPKPSCTKNKYLLTIVDEYSRFPFAFPCSDISSTTVIDRLMQLFVLCGFPALIHSDRGSQFMSCELRKFLSERGIAQSRTTPYNPQGNGQCERYNGIIWKAVQLAIHQKKLREGDWEKVLPDALHSIRSLLCTATSETPHERLFQFPRKSLNGTSLPKWLSNPGPVLLRRHDRRFKSDPLVKEVQLVSTNPNYALVRDSDGQENTVSLRDLAPCANSLPQEYPTNEVSDLTTDDPVLRRSTRIRRPPDRYCDVSYS